MAEQTAAERVKEYLKEQREMFEDWGTSEEARSQLTSLDAACEAFEEVDAERVHAMAVCLELQKERDLAHADVIELTSRNSNLRAQLAEEKKSAAAYETAYRKVAAERRELEDQLESRPKHPQPITLKQTKQGKQFYDNQDNQLSKAHVLEALEQLWADLGRVTINMYKWKGRAHGLASSYLAGVWKELDETAKEEESK